MISLLRRIRRVGIVIVGNQVRTTGWSLLPGIRNSARSRARSARRASSRPCAARFPESNAICPRRRCCSRGPPASRRSFRSPAEPMRSRREIHSRLRRCTPSRWRARCVPSSGRTAWASTAPSCANWNIAGRSWRSATASASRSSRRTYPTPQCPCRPTLRRGHSERLPAPPVAGRGPSREPSLVHPD